MMLRILRVARFWALSWACLAVVVMGTASFIGGFIGNDGPVWVMPTPNPVVVAVSAGLFSLLYGGLSGIVYGALSALFARALIQDKKSALAAATLGVVSGSAVIVGNVVLVLVVERTLVSDFVGVLAIAGALGGVTGMVTRHIGVARTSAEGKEADEQDARLVVPGISSPRNS